MAEGLHSQIPPEKLRTHNNEIGTERYDELHNRAQAIFFRKVIAGKHDVSFEDVQSRDPKYADDFISIFTEVRPWFEKWWNDEDNKPNTDEGADSVAERAYETFRSPTLH